MLLLPVCHDIIVGRGTADEKSRVAKDNAMGRRDRIDIDAGVFKRALPSILC